MKKCVAARECAPQEARGKRQEARAEARAEAEKIGESAWA